jgi:hypothetical protein
MFRRLNLRNVCGDKSGEKSRMRTEHAATGMLS